MSGIWSWISDFFAYARNNVSNHNGRLDVGTFVPVWSVKGRGTMMQKKKKDRIGISWIRSKAKKDR